MRRRLILGLCLASMIALAGLFLMFFFPEPPQHGRFSALWLPSHLWRSRMIRQGEASIPELVSELHSEDWVTRRAAMACLARLGQPGAVALGDFITGGDLVHGDRYEKQNAVVWLATMGDAALVAVPALAKANGTAPPWDKRYAPKDWGPEDYGPIGGWYGCCRDALIEFSGTLIYQLGTAGIPGLEQMSSDPDPDVRLAASLMIQRIENGVPTDENGADYSDMLTHQVKRFHQY